MISAHVLLDSCSQGAFVKKSIVEMTEVGGTLISITIKTLDGNVTNSSVGVEGLKVCAVAASGNNRWIKTKKFSQDELQVDVEDIATPKTLPKWEYLQLFS